MNIFLFQVLESVNRMVSEHKSSVIGQYRIGDAFELLGVIEFESVIGFPGNDDLAVLKKNKPSSTEELCANNNTVSNLKFTVVPCRGPFLRDYLYNVPFRKAS